MSAASATFNWAVAPKGTWRIYVALKDPAGQESLQYATGPVVIN